MVWRAAIVVAVAVGVCALIGSVARDGLWHLLNDAPVLWLIIAGIPMATLAALVVPERAWHQPAPPRVRGYIEPATMPAMAPAPSYAALPSPQVVHHYHHHTHELIGQSGLAALPPVVVEGIESSRRTALPAPRPRTGP